MPLPYQQYTTLKFSSLEALWEFQKLAGLRNFHLDSLNYTLQAQLTDKQLELALILKATEHPKQKSG